jgi:hypothetical protein
VGHKHVDLLLRHCYTGQGICQFKASVSSTIEKKIDLTISRFAAGIGHLRVLKGQLVMTAKGVNSLKMKLFDTVACLESGLMEFSHALDQSGQVVIHQRFFLLILDDGGAGRGLFTHGRD